MSKKVKILLLSLLIILYMFSVTEKAFQNDTFFDIALGKIIIEKGLTNEEELVFHEGLEFKNPRWLFDYVVANIYNNIGEVGVYGMVVAIGCLEMLLYFYITNKISNKPILSFIYTILIASFMRVAIAARGQLFSFFMFLIIYYSLEEYFKTYKKRYLVLIIAALPIIAYSHGSIYVMAGSLFMPYIAEFVVSKFKNLNFEGKLIVNERKIALLVVPIVIFVLIGLITPNHLNLLTYSYKTMQGEKFISEMKEVTFFDDTLFSVSLAVLFIIVGFTRTKVRLTDLLYIIGYSFVTFKAIRGVHYFYLLASISMFRLICDYIDEYNIKIEVNKKYKIASKIIGCLLLVLLVVSSIKRILVNFNMEYIPYEEYPVDVADYIIDNIDYKNAHVYSDYDFGSYLEFRGIPVFIDSRAELFTPEFNEGTTILEDYYQAIYGGKNFNEIFDKYDIDCVVVQKDHSLIYSYIRYDDKWNSIYDDISFAIYERN